MNAKLTLTVEKSVIEKAKVFARNTGRSLSELVENYLDGLTQPDQDQTASSKLNKIIGAVKLPESFDEESERRAYLEKKHL